MQCKGEEEEVAQYIYRERERDRGRAIALFLLRLDRLHLSYIYSLYRTCVPNYGRYPYRLDPPFLNKPNSYLNQSPHGGATIP